MKYAIIAIVLALAGCAGSRNNLHYPDYCASNCGSPVNSNGVD